LFYKDKYFPDLQDLFFKRFKIAPSQVSFAPGRINLIGEHVDYLGGKVLPAAIDLGITVLGSSDTSSTLVVSALDLDEEVVWKKEAMSGAVPPSWQAYVWGVIKEIMALGIDFPSGKIAFSGDLPKGAGLSSSAALEVALANYFLKAANKKVDSVALSKIAHRAENLHVGTNCGIMDQFASVHGRCQHFMILDCASLETEYVRMKLGEHSWLLINSMVSHELGSQYNDIRSELESAENKINKGPLITLTLPILEESKNRLTTGEFERARYVIGEIKRTKHFISAIQGDNLIEAGQLLTQTHWGLSQDLKVSTEELDALVNSASQCEGWLGGRMMGGGFGGCSLNLVHNDFRDAIVTHVQNNFRVSFDLTPEIIPVTLGQGAYTKVLKN